MIYRLLHIDPANQNDRDLFYLVLEIFWASILNAVVTFNGAFAVRLGSSSTVIGLLTSAPALLAIMISIPAGRFLKARKQIKSWTLWTLGIYRAGFLLVAIIPLLPKMGIPLGELVVLSLVIITIPAHFFNVGFLPMMAMVIPEERRPAVFAARNIVFNASLSVCTFLFGFWLSYIQFPQNYQILYVFGFATSMVSMYYLVKIRVPEQIPQPVVKKKEPIQKKLDSFRQAIARNPGFFQITLNTLLHGSGLWAATPLYILYYVRILGAPDSWVGLLGTIGSVATIAGWTIWRSVMNRWGDQKTLKRTIILLGLFPVLVACVPSLPIILVIAGINGLVVPGVNISHLNTLLRVTPDHNRAEYTAIYMTVANIGAFIFPLIGVAVSDQIGLVPTLICCGILSILGSSSFWWMPVQKGEKKATVPQQVVDL